MNKVKRLLMTILTSGIATILSFLISFILTPYITNKLGVEAYGFVTLAKNFTQYATIITIALNSYAARYITVSYHNNDMEKAQEYISSVYYGDVAISAVIMIVAGGFILFLDRILNISLELVTSVKMLFLYVFLGFVLTTVGTSYTAAAYIKNRLDIVGIFRSLSYIFEVLFYVIVFTFFTPKVWQVGVAICVAQLVIFGGDYYIYKKYTPELKIKRKNVSFKAIKKLVVNGIWNSINSLGNTLNSGLDLIVTNLWLSDLAMGQIAITSLFSSIVFAAFFSLGKVFYALWIPGQDIDLIYVLTVITMLSSVIEGPVYPLYYIYTLTVKNKIPCLVTVVGGILNVAGMAILVKYSSLGIYSIVLTTTVIMLFINLVTNPIYMTHCLKIEWFTFYPTLLRTIISCTCMTISFTLIAKTLNPNTWVSFVLTAILCGVIGCIIHLVFVFSRDEKSRILVIIKSKEK